MSKQTLITDFFKPKDGSVQSSDKTNIIIKFLIWIIGSGSIGNGIALGYLIIFIFMILAVLLTILLDFFKL